jgi:hypothetical protein
MGVFKVYSKNIFRNRDTKEVANFFNIIEYTLLQASLASLFTNGQTLCYVTDGQNGLEFAFTGWFAIPIVFLLSVLFQQVQKAKLEQETELE